MGVTGSVPGVTVSVLCKLELVVGSPASCMELELYGTDDELLGRLDCDEALLGSYELWDGCRVHVIDRSGARIGEYEDVSQVEKYEMTESDYDKRPGEAVGHLWGNTQPSRRGTVMYCPKYPQNDPNPPPPHCPQPPIHCPPFPTGQTDFKPGHWVGVRYDEPLGKHDVYSPKYGAFVKPQSVTPGDFPEEELGLEEEEL
uniref:CAP-Gly domain-containing protein n=1 Tax=Melopsittacus undulatus TaxID=13146 RepID=A0A8V5GMA7_MELUD